MDAVCNPLCANGGECVGPNLCSCPEGYAGSDCKTAMCVNGCMHGFCSSPGVCTCITGYEGSMCDIAKCDPPCVHGDCSDPGICTCMDKWSGVDCSEETYVCGQSGCHHGECIGDNLCDCQAGYTGDYCEDTVCEPSCSPGGMCVAPGVCECDAYHEGTHCQVQIISVDGSPVDKLEQSLLENMGLCTMNGKHFRSFDGTHYTFPGECTYVMASDCSEIGSTSFQILVNTVYDCSGSLCRCAVHIRSELLNIAILPDDIVTINDRPIEIPHSINDVIITQSGTYTILEGLNGVKITYDGMDSVAITVDSSYMGNMCGLCGDYNGNKTDDFSMRPYKYHEIAKSVEEFGNVMKETGVACNPVEHISYPCISVAFEDLEYMRGYCHQLENLEAFKACNAYVNPAPYMDRCLYDMCDCNIAGGDQVQCACNAFTEYSRVCALHGIVLSWRSDKFCGR
ncbi:von Willebrand factor-like [Saccoglossus kowalevskii]